MRCPKCQTPVSSRELKRHLAHHLGEIIPEQPTEEDAHYRSRILLSNIFHLYGWEGIVGLVLDPNHETVRRMVDDGCNP